MLWVLLPLELPQVVVLVMPLHHIPLLPFCLACFISPSLPHVGLSVFVLLTTLVLLLFTLSLVTSLLYLCSLSKSSTLIPTLAGQVEDPPAYA